MIEDAGVTARRILGAAAQVRVFDPALGEPGPPLDEVVAAAIAEDRRATLVSAAAEISRWHKNTDHDKYEAAYNAAIDQMSALVRGIAEKAPRGDVVLSGARADLALKDAEIARLRAPLPADAPAMHESEWGTHPAERIVNEIGRDGSFSTGANLSRAAAIIAKHLTAPLPADAMEGDGGITQQSRTLLTALQSIMLGDEATPDPEAMAEIARAITAARADEHRKAIEGAAELCDDYARDGRLDKEYACEVADEIAARIRALADKQPAPTATPEVSAIQRPSDEDLFAAIRPLWLATKPSAEAQRIRAALSCDFDDPKYKQWMSDFIPDYVWSLVDIAAQRAATPAAPPDNGWVNDGRY